MGLTKVTSSKEISWRAGAAQPNRVLLAVTVNFSRFWSRPVGPLEEKFMCSEQASASFSRFPLSKNEKKKRKGTIPLPRPATRPPHLIWLAADGKHRTQPPRAFIYLDAYVHAFIGPTTTPVGPALGYGSNNRGIIRATLRYWSKRLPNLLI